MPTKWLDKLEKLLHADREGAVEEWGNLIAEFGVLWLTFGWLEKLRDVGIHASWCDVAWLGGCLVVGLVAMWTGVMMKVRKD